MNKDYPNWKKDIFPAPPANTRLHEAWLTSYRLPDTELMIEYFLPSLLGMEQSLSQGHQERAEFFGELNRRLVELKDRLTVICSPVQEKVSATAYPWLWRFLTLFTVGSDSSVVQHSKLWVFHWFGKNHEYLELHISSTNLSKSAFKDQLQAGWKIRLQLEKKSLKKRLKDWGNLIPFLIELGKSAGEKGSERIERLISLLGRAEPPDDVTFISSIPNQKKHPSPAQLLREKFKSTGISEIHVLTPSIGEWDNKSLKDWSKDAVGENGKVYLKWISADHPWAGSGGWSLSIEAGSMLNESGVIQRLPSEFRLTPFHLDEDTRWSHAKLYLLRIKNKQKRMLLITSANWSPSAWGGGNKMPSNFELGVLIETYWKELENIDGSFDTYEPHFSDSAFKRKNKLQWVQASWDGNIIQLMARSSEPETPIFVKINFIDKSEKEIQVNSNDEKKLTELVWKNDTCEPVTAFFYQSDNVLETYVFDMRPDIDVRNIPIPEVDPEFQQNLRDRFLLERYGGKMTGDGNGRGARDDKSKKETSRKHSSDDYTVQAWFDAREAFNVIDQWKAALTEVNDDDLARKQVYSDGHELLDLYLRKNEPVYALVVEELHWHLKG